MTQLSELRINCVFDNHDNLPREMAISIPRHNRLDRLQRLYLIGDDHLVLNQIAAAFSPLAPKLKHLAVLDLRANLLARAAPVQDAADLYYRQIREHFGELDSFKVNINHEFIRDLLGPRYRDRFVPADVGNNFRRENFGIEVLVIPRHQAANLVNNQDRQNQAPLADDVALVLRFRRLPLNRVNNEFQDVPAMPIPDQNLAANQPRQQAPNPIDNQDPHIQVQLANNRAPPHILRMIHGHEQRLAEIEDMIRIELNEPVPNQADNQDQHLPNQE